MMRVSLHRAVVPLLFALTATAGAQMSRWQLGNPSLILDLPAAPSGGGVGWHDTGMISLLPTSWSAESGDVRVEISSSYTQERPEAVAQRLAAKLGLALKEGAVMRLSGSEGYRFNLGGRLGVALTGEGRSWVVLTTPKTSNGTSLARAVLGSIVLERGGTPRWVRRSLGGTRMNAELPYELAPEADAPDPNAKGYELHFGDFGVRASLETAGAGMKIDFERTIQNLIDAERAKSGRTEFEAKRERVKGDRLEGEIVRMAFTQGTRRYQTWTFFGRDEGRLLRLNLNGDARRPEHAGFAERILRTLKVTSTNFSGFEPRPVGDEGVWLDAPKAFDGPKVDGSIRRYGVFGGAFAVDVDVIALPAGARQNVPQFMTIQEVGFKPRGSVRDYSAETTKMLVDGVDARVLRMRYKESGRGDFTLRTVLALFLPDRTVVAKMIANEGQGDYLERMIQTARVEIIPPSGWTRHAVGESGMSMLAPKAPKTEKLEPSEAGTESIAVSSLDAPGMIVDFQEIRYKADAPLPGVMLQTRVQSLGRALGRTLRIAEQRPYEVGSRTGVIASLEYDMPDGRKGEGDLLILRRGNQLSMLIILAPNMEQPGVALQRALFLNSLR